LQLGLPVLGSLQLRLPVLVELERRLRFLVELGLRMQPEMLPVFLLANEIASGRAKVWPLYYKQNPASAAGFRSVKGQS